MHPIWEIFRPDYYCMTEHITVLDIFPFIVDFFKIVDLYYYTMWSKNFLKKLCLSKPLPVEWYYKNFYSVICTGSVMRQSFLKVFRKILSENFRISRIYWINNSSVLHVYKSYQFRRVWYSYTILTSTN